MNSGQPVGDLCDLLGVPREWPEVFDEIERIVRIHRESDERTEMRALNEATLARMRAGIRT